MSQTMTFREKVADKYSVLGLETRSNTLPHVLGCLIAHFDSFEREAISKDDLTRIMSDAIDAAEQITQGVAKEVKIRK